MSKSEVKIGISVPAVGYSRRMFFNRFAIQKIDGHSLVHFGLLDGTGILRDYYACLFSKQTLKDSEKSLKSYLIKIGVPTNTMTPWVPPTHLMQSDFANIINVGQTDEAEILLSAFAVGPAINKSKSSDKPIEIQAVALLRCDPDLQRLLLVELYSAQ